MGMMESVRALAATYKEAEKKAEENVQYMRPENHVFSTFAKIKIARNVVCVIYPKDEAFMDVMRSAKFSWNRNLSAWCLSITECTGSAEDRAADIAACLLRAGFPVAVPSVDVREKVTHGTFSPLHPRWIVPVDYDKVGFVWLHGDLAEAIGKYRGTQRVKAGSPFDAKIAISSDAFEIVDLIAHAHDFRITKQAAERLKMSQKTFDDAIILRTVPLPATQTSTKAGYDVDPDLLDD